DSPGAAQVDVATSLYALDSQGHITGPPAASIRRSSASVAAGSNTTLNGDTTLSHPKLWGPPPHQKPNLYVAVTLVSQHGRPIDRYETTFGVRSLRLQSDGVYVNGERTLIKGVNDHHDLGALGTAFNLRAAERQLETLREMGCNAIRMAHNPPAP